MVSIFQQHTNYKTHTRIMGFRWLHEADVPVNAAIYAERRELLQSSDILRVTKRYNNAFK